MAFSNFDGIAITGLAAAVPSRRIDNLVPYETFSELDAAAVVEQTGIRYRRWADPSTCASDLCFIAAERLLTEMKVDRNAFDDVIFASQTPDYRMPATAFLLQDRLGLGNNTAAFDVNLGCSGYIQGLILAFSIASVSEHGRVLLLNGETRTRAYSFHDKATGLLFGDAGTATSVEQNKKSGKSYFSMNADGARADFIKIPSGGYRNPSDGESIIEKPQPDGGFRSDEQGTIDGVGIFELLINEVPADLNRTLRESGCKENDIDYAVFHQANRFMNEYLRKKMKISFDKVPYSLDEFGNTSGVSIPLTMVTRISDILKTKKSKVLLAGFGVGFSWGSAILDVGPMHVSDLIELKAGSL